MAFRENPKVLSWHKKEHAESDCHAEAKALLPAVQVAVNTNWTSVIFQSDSRDLVLVVNRKTNAILGLLSCIKRFLDPCPVFCYHFLYLDS